MESNQKFSGRCRAGLVDCHQHFRWRTSFFLSPSKNTPLTITLYYKTWENHILFHALRWPVDTISSIIVSSRLQWDLKEKNEDLKRVFHSYKTIFKTDFNLNMNSNISSNESKYRIFELRFHFRRNGWDNVDASVKQLKAPLSLMSYERPIFVHCICRKQNFFFA